MKKLFTIILAFTLCLSLTACSCGGGGPSYSSVSGTYFLNDPSNLDVGNVDEVATYAVTVEPFSGAKITAEVSGEYKTTLTNTTCDVLNSEGATENVKCYKLVAEFSLNGSYKYNNETITVADSFTSTVYFYGAKDRFKPIKTHKEMKSTSPYVNNQGNLVINKVDYSYDVDYTSGKAVVAFTENGDKVLNLPESFNHDLPANFCENELLLLYPRLFNLSQGYNVKLATYVAVQNANINLQTTLASSNQKLTNNFIYEGRPQTEIKVDCVAIAQNGTYTGSGLYGYYTTLDGAKFNKAVLVKAQSGIDQVGVLTYTLTNYEDNLTVN